MEAGLHDTGSGPGWHAEPAHRHLVQFYETDEFLLETLARFVTRTLSHREAAIVVARPGHMEALSQRLADAGVDVPVAISGGQLAMLDIDRTMSRIMEDGTPHLQRFETVFAPIIDQAHQSWGGVRVFGEMVALTAETHDWSATIKLEQIWNDLLERHEFSLYCAYPITAFSRAGEENLLDNICNQHSAVFPAESYSLTSSRAERFQAIARLQQQAARLSVEVDSRKQIEDRLRVALNAERAARQEAESALRLRDEFVSVAAHELKTPLTSLIGRAQYLLRTQQRGTNLTINDLSDAVQSVADQAEKLSRLIDQLLDVSRLRGGKLAIERHSVDLVKLVRESIQSVQPAHSEPRYMLAAPESVIAEVDPLRLEQVIVNLLNNAAKYSPPDGVIEIGISSPSESDIQITVRDQGPGIPVESRDRIFDRFYQAQELGPPGGLGLGLYISRQIVELHQGSLRAEFPEDGGTRLVIALPRHESSGTLQPGPA